MEITIENPLDMHVHLRQGNMLDLVVKHTALNFSGALIMPNLFPNPVLHLSCAKEYQSAILRAVKDWGSKYADAEGRVHLKAFKPYMTLFFHKGLTREVLEVAKKYVLAIKFYPQGVTTHSDGGLCPFTDKDVIQRILGDMEELGIPLCIHPEYKDMPVMKRERGFLNIVANSWAYEFPKLKIILEHITTTDSLRFLEDNENVFATVTVHHLLHTLDDVVGGMLQPHNFCKPIPKTIEDRDDLRRAVKRGHPKLMLGTDSAPHIKANKEAEECCAGVYSAPNALPDLVEMFSDWECLDRLQAFVSDNARRIYGIAPPEKTVVLERAKGQQPPRDPKNKGKPNGGYSPNVPVPWRPDDVRAWRVKEVLTPVTA